MAENFSHIDGSTPGKEHEDTARGGFFDQTGRIYLAPNVGSVPESHIKAHELTHALAASGGLDVIDGKPHATGNGLQQMVANDGTALPNALMNKLWVLNEAMIDSVAAAASGLDLENYIASEAGYSILVRDLRTVRTVNPRAFNHMFRCVFKKGVASFDEAYSLVKSYSQVIPAMKLPDFALFG